MKKIVWLSSCITLCFVLLNLSSSAQAPTWQWAKTAAKASSSRGSSVCVDHWGNSYATGNFYDTITFGSTTLISNGITNFYLVKYDPFGVELWAKCAGGRSTNFGYSVAVDDSGNVFLGGSFGDTAIFGSITMVNNTGTELFVAKYDPSGNALWVRKAGGTLDEQIRSVSTDPSGNCYVAGHFRSPSITFGAYTLTNNSNISGQPADLFFVKYDPNGNVLWAKKAGGSTDPDYAYAITADASGNCFIAGRFYSPSISLGNNLTNSGQDDLFLAKYNSAGSPLWAKNAIGASYDEAYSVSSDAAGNSYITGSFRSSTLTFGSVTLTNSDNSTNTYDLFVAKYDPNGNAIWAKGASGISHDEGNSIVSDSLGNTYVTGYFISPTLTFGSITLTNAGGYDIFLVKYDPSGNVLWAKSAGSTNSSIANCVAIDDWGNSFITGVFSDLVLTFGSTMLPNASTNNDEMFIAKTGDNAAGIYSPGFSAHGISIFPNPSSGIFSLELNDENISEPTIEIYDVLGRLVFKTEIVNQKTEIDLSGNAKGIYFYRVFNATENIGSGKMMVN